jgi:TPP-dependent pyruvate/acetoin dehydrogenase alpha subunit
MAIKTIAERALAYGIPHEMIDGNDMLAVYAASKRAVDRARSGEGPTLIGVDTMRMRGHAEHDDMRYVPASMLDEWRDRDPIARLRKHLLETKAATEQQLTEIEHQTRTFAEQEADEALAAPLPDPASGAYGVYAGEEEPRRRVELVRSPFRAAIEAAARERATAHA